MATMGNVLVVEDKSSMREMLVMALDQANYCVDQAADGEEGMNSLKSKNYDLVVSDLKMPKMDGLELLKASRELHQPPAFIMITAHGSIPDAVEAINLGAFDFIEKPFELEELEFKAAEAIGAQAPLGSGQGELPGLIGKSAQMAEVADISSRVSGANLPVLITGDTGTGKEKLARIVHDLSQRAEKPFLMVNCADKSTNLESALFGHEKDAFKEAGEAKVGALEEASGGTVFIDDFESLSSGAQHRLLQFLQNKSFERMGGSTSIEPDVRIVAATKKNLAENVATGALREDLYYRIKGVTIHLPPLRERGSDLQALVDHFLEQANKEHDREITFSPRVVKLMADYPWPGNVRELASVIDRCVVMAAGDTVVESELPEEVRNPDKLKSNGGNLTGDLESIERDRLLNTLEKHDWNQTRSAKTLGIGRTALQYKMQKYGLKKPS